MKRLLIIVALLGTFIPVAFVVHEAGGWQNWQGVLPKGQVDSLYYYARAHEVVDGYPLIGNPYLYEHRGSFTPSFFIPDIVSAVPALLGVPFDAATAINMFVWSLVFLLLSFALLRLLRLPPWWAFFGSVLMYLMAFTYIIRPTVLQLIYPVFLAFLISLLKFLYEPSGRRRILLLSLASALAVYAYILLGYIVFITLGCVFFWFLFKRSFKELRALAASGMITAFLLIPFGIYTVIQMKDPYYLETFIRIGSVYTHIPAFESFYYGRWIIIGLAAFSLLWFFFPKKGEGDSARKVFWLATGASLFAGFLLNVVTGVDVSLAIHTGRFFFVWMTMMSTVIAYEWYISCLPASEITGNEGQKGITKAKIAKYISAIFIVAIFAGVVKNIPPGPSFFNFNKDGSFADTQSYAGPLNWLEKNVPEQSVIWANESISAYIPIMTRHYVLFHENAEFHFIPGEELVDRYLLSHSLGVLTVEDLKRDLGLYTGLISYLQSFDQNQRVRLCEILAHVDGNLNCPPRIDAVALRGEDYFMTLETRFNLIKKNQAVLLKQYHVAYLIVDRLHDNVDIKQITAHKALYDDGRFTVLSVPL